jgi:hypothetical protein
MRRVLIFVFAVLCVAGCKKTADGERSRFQASRDRIEAVGTKNPSMKADIQAKLAEFDKAFKAADAKSGDDQIAALASLNDRMSGYEKAIAPAPAAAPDASAASKLGSKLPPASQPASAPASAPSKLGAAPASAPAAPPSKLAPASAPASPPAPKSGFGGGTPDAPAKSGFGGK